MEWELNLKTSHTFKCGIDVLEKNGLLGSYSTIFDFFENFVKMYEIHQMFCSKVEKLLFSSACVKNKTFLSEFAFQNSWNKFCGLFDIFALIPMLFYNTILPILQELEDEIFSGDSVL